MQVSLCIAVHLKTVAIWGGIVGTVCIWLRTLLVLEVIKDQKVGNGAFLPFLVDNGFCMFGGENPIDDREQGVLVTVLFLIFLGSLYLVYPIFFDIWKTTKDEQVNFSELFEFLRVS